MRRFLSRVRRAVAVLRRGARIRLLTERDKRAISRSTPAAGSVTTFDHDQILGWLDASGSSPTGLRVSLHVNDLAVAATWAEQRVDEETGRPRHDFRFALDEIWRYCRTSDRLTLRVDGRPLKIEGHGLALRPSVNGDRSPLALRHKLTHGFVFSHSGQLQLSKSLDTAWQEAVLGLYDRVREVVTESVGADVFLVYGSLLGAVRDKGFIGHDRDLDCAFISSATTGRGAARELAKIAYALIAIGLDVECRSSALHIHQVGSAKAKIDLFHLFFDSTGNLNFPFGIAGTSQFTVDDWRGTQTIDLVGRRVLVPAAAEQMVEYLYGSSWRRPIPGFNWVRDRTSRARGAGVPQRVRGEIYWTNYYARNAPSGPSPFLDHLLAHHDPPGSVVDIGCGDGRDALGFAASGRRVIGVDMSNAAIQRASTRAAEVAPDQGLQFVVLDVSDAAALRNVIDEARGSDPDAPVLFYARFFMHTVTEQVQDSVLDCIHDAGRQGDWIAAEFRSGDGRPLPRRSKDRFRRPIDVDTFVTRLRDECGFTVIERQQGAGLSPHGGEDPTLCRVVARRDQPRD